MADRGRVTRREALRITAVGGLSLALGGGLVRELLRQAGLHRVHDTRTHMGTLVSLTFVHPDASRARDGVRAGFDEMARLESILSRHAPGTPMAELNRTGGLDRAPGELLHLLDTARRWHELTGGAFDPSVAPLLERYAARHREGRGPPPDSEIREVLARSVGFDGVEVRGGRVRFVRPGMALTLDGVAKGFIVDRTVAALARAGGERVLVDAGGDMASGGRDPSSEPWPVDVQDPHHARRSLGRIGLTGGAVATSGDYARTFTPDRRHHHILDPRTGRSPDHTSSVTVRAPSAMEADALSTALLVLGPGEGLRVLERVPGAEGLLVAKDGTRHASAGMDSTVG